ncbi:ABC transporter ATP-binding protein [Methylobacterium sp. Leaf469]|uniref:ABC transporter ATP-binding protein n=1 Tax=Methylobacterium sp. Leaf469 TaxID=1736387 RepID=UPI0006FB5042|nr:ABC transporter ATP-binding protein [Methylobacterium sp. Leaf469]KQT93291.1 ABC transporter ATP-binding protein [Methylobacterium sp. Leaf469]
MGDTGSVPRLGLEGVTKRFGDGVAVADVSLALAAGEFFCLLGPSGCGKSTLLRLIAGFETPSTGLIRVDGLDLAGLPPHRRPVNMMFQSYALFPHKTVAGNIAYGLDGLSRTDRSARVKTLLARVRLENFEDRRIETLSGGQRQRVALARALAREPGVLLLDEPLGALDRGLREETQGELRALQRRLGTTFVMVTHDPGEAMALADRIGVMDRGRLVQVGDAATLYERPATRFVAGLLGDVNLIPGRITGRDGEWIVVETGFGPLRARASESAPGEGEAATLALRPERIGMDASEGPAGTITEVTYLGERVRSQVRMNDGTLLRVSTPAASHAFGLQARDLHGPGDTIRLDLAPEACRILPP